MGHEVEARERQGGRRTAAPGWGGEGPGRGGDGSFMPYASVPRGRSRGRVEWWMICCERWKGGSFAVNGVDGCLTCWEWGRVKESVGAFFLWLVL